MNFGVKKIRETQERKKSSKLLRLELYCFWNPFKV